MSDDAPGRDRAALVHRAQGGDGDAFAELARLCGRAVYAIALAHLGRPADAEDVAQNVLLAALENIDGCRDPARFDAWILSIARNRARRALVRRRLRDVFSGGDAATLERGTEDPVSPERQALLRALAKLPATSREVVMLHDLEGYTHAEITAALGLSEEASRQALSRARKQLRMELEP
jgi:RNA polymerase sigma-70 factor (ECF subfamily)